MSSFVARTLVSCPWFPCASFCNGLPQCVAPPAAPGQKDFSAKFWQPCSNERNKLARTSENGLKWQTLLELIVKKKETVSGNTNSPWAASTLELKLLSSFSHFWPDSDSLVFQSQSKFMRLNSSKFRQHKPDKHNVIIQQKREKRSLKSYCIVCSTDKQDTGKSISDLKNSSFGPLLMLDSVLGV